MAKANNTEQILYGVMYSPVDVNDFTKNYCNKEWLTFEVMEIDQIIKVNGYKIKVESIKEVNSTKIFK